MLDTLPQGIPSGAAVFADAWRRGLTLPPPTTVFSDSKLAESRERVALLRLDRMEREGKLVDRADVDRTAFSLIRAAIDALMAMPDRLCAQLAAETDSDKTRDLLDSEVRHIAESLSRGAAQFSEPAVASVATASSRPL